MYRATGPGKYTYKNNAANDWTVLLYNYDIEGKKLKKEHKDFLIPTVVPLLKAGCGVTIFGQTSTTGTVEFDNALAIERVNDLLYNLRAWVPTPFPLGRLEGRGKSMALSVTGRDNTEDEAWRAVWLRVWDQKHPPPDLGGGTINPNITPGSPTLGNMSSALDIIGGVVSIVDLGLDIAATYSTVAAVATAGTVTGVGGLILAAISSIIGMPAIWASTDALAEFNGTVQGYADAMQDMAEQYQDNSLDRKPVKQWPALTQPTPHIFNPIPTTTSEEFWRKGQRKGCNEAYLAILKMEVNPIEVDASVGGKTSKIKANGKMVLRALWVSTRGNVGSKIVSQVNDMLRSQGKPLFPTH